MLFPIGIYSESRSRNSLKHHTEILPRNIYDLSGDLDASTSVTRPFSFCLFTVSVIEGYVGPLSRSFTVPAASVTVKGNFALFLFEGAGTGIHRHISCLDVRYVCLRDVCVTQFALNMMARLLAWLALDGSRARGRSTSSCEW